MTEKTLPKIARGTSRPGLRTSPATYTTPSQPSIVYTTACKLRRIAIINGQPEGTAGNVGNAVEDAAAGVECSRVSAQRETCGQRGSGTRRSSVRKSRAGCHCPSESRATAKSETQQSARQRTCNSWPARTGEKITAVLGDDNGHGGGSSASREPIAPPNDKTGVFADCPAREIVLSAASRN